MYMTENTYLHIIMKSVININKSIEGQYGMIKS